MKYNHNSLRVHLLFILTSNVVALKLIPGDRSVVKKDGETHTISKYYLVPNDFDINERANNSESQKPVLRGRYMKSMNYDEGLDGNSKNENKTNINVIPLQDTYVNTKEESVSTENYADINEINGNYAGELVPQLTPDLELTNNILRNSQKEANNSVDTETQNNIQVNNTEEDDIIKTDNASNQHLQALFQELDTMLQNYIRTNFEHPEIKKNISLTIYDSYVNSVSDINEKNIRLKKLALVLTAFEILYKHIEYNNPIDSLIDNLFVTLTRPVEEVVVKDDFIRNSLEDKDVTEKIRRRNLLILKCLQESSTDNLDSNNNSISKTIGHNTSLNFKLTPDEPDSQRRDADVNIESITSATDDNTEQVKTNQRIDVDKNELLDPNILENDTPVEIISPGGYEIYNGSPSEETLSKNKSVLNRHNAFDEGSRLGDKKVINNNVKNETSMFNIKPVDYKKYDGSLKPESLSKDKGIPNEYNILSFESRLNKRPGLENESPADYTIPTEYEIYNGSPITDVVTKNKGEVGGYNVLSFKSRPNKGSGFENEISVDKINPKVNKESPRLKTLTKNKSVPDGYNIVYLDTLNDDSGLPNIQNVDYTALAPDPNVNYVKVTNNENRPTKYKTYYDQPVTADVKHVGPVFDVPDNRFDKSPFHLDKPKGKLLENIDAILNNSSPDIDERLSDNNPDIDERLSDNNPDIDEILTENSPDINERLSDNNPEIDESVNVYDPDIDERLSDNDPDIDERLSDNNPYIDERLSDNHPDIDEGLSDNNPDIDERWTPNNPDIDKNLGAEKMPGANSEIIKDQWINRPLEWIIDNRDKYGPSYNIQGRNTDTLSDDTDERIRYDPPYTFDNTKHHTWPYYTLADRHKQIKNIIVRHRIRQPKQHTYIIHPTKTLYTGPQRSTKFIKIESGKHKSSRGTHYFSNEPSYSTYKFNSEKKSNTAVPEAVPSYYKSYKNAIKSIKKKGSTNANPLVFLPNAGPNLHKTDNLSELALELGQEEKPYESGLKSTTDASVHNNQERKLPVIGNTVDNSQLQHKTEINQIFPTISSQIDLNRNLEPSTKNYQYSPNVNVNFIKPLNIPKNSLKQTKYEMNDYNVPAPYDQSSAHANAQVSNNLNKQNIFFMKQRPITLVHPTPVPIYTEIVADFKHELPPSYQLFTEENLLKLRDALLKKKLTLGPYENAALKNLHRMNTVLLTVAKYLGGNKWYAKIFNSDNKNEKNILENYVSSLLRQQWLHELMLLLTNSNFNLNIINNPKIYSILELWQFPNYILDYLSEAENSANELNYITNDGPQNIMTDNIKAVLAGHDTSAPPVAPDVLDIYDSASLVNNYRVKGSPDREVVVGLSGVNEDIDAYAVIEILIKYLRYKQFVKQQENLESQIKMFKQIILLLKKKGYGSSIITDLLKKLYGSVYVPASKSCKFAHHANFVDKMYDIIVPVLRRSGS